MIEYLTKVEVGKFYQVPCIAGKDGTPIPIIPFKHADPQFGTKNASKPHYHVDGRFVGKKQLPHLLVDDDYLTEYELVKIADFRIASIIIKDDGIFFKRKKCFRLFSGQVPSSRLAQGKADFQSFNWYKTQKGKSCAGRKCPHYGIEMLVNGRGFLECPLHGLIGDKKNEIIIGNVHFNPEMI